MVGRALVPVLVARGHHVAVLVRGAARSAGEISWLPNGQAPVERLAQADGVVNLAGASIAGGRWTAKRRALLRKSRIGTTQALVLGLRTSARSGRVLVNASACGYYGNCGETVVTEEAPHGSGFLADLCRDWETAALAAEADGIRVVCPRFGIILGGGGVLARLEPLFRWGLGGRLGSGRQWMSWIALSDVVAGIVFALEADRLRGPVNFVSSQPIRNKDFTAELARALHRHVGLPVPAGALRLLYGSMADEALLASTRALPQGLSAAGFRFQRIQLQDALSEGLAQG